MKWIKTVFIISLISALQAGCATNLSKQAMINSRSDVFSQINKNSNIPAGQTDLNISASVKTHREFECPINQPQAHGTAAYKLVLNIDGQVVELSGRMQNENNEAGGVMNPEAGDGIRYRFGNSLRLKAGIHKIIVALPDDGIAVEREITLIEGGVNNLVVEPIYSTTQGKKAPGVYCSTSFKEGIRGVKLSLNGRNI
jgi:hypothetical protein